MLAAFTSHSGDSLCEFFQGHSRQWLFVGSEKRKPALSFRVVLLDQSLKTRMAS
jgi:hypothetical protein